MNCPGSLTLAGNRSVFNDWAGECAICHKVFGDHMQIKSKSSGQLVYRIPVHEASKKEVDKL